MIAVRGSGATGRIAVLVLACVAGAVGAALLMPALFRATPTDVSRIGRILEAQRDPGFAPRIVALGNSVVMSAFDGAQLRRELPGEPEAVNLASTGQSLVESYLLQQGLPKSVRTVVQLVTLTSLLDYTPLETHKYNTFYLNGFRPDATTASTLREIYGDEVGHLLARSDLAQRFGGRWALRQLPDTRLRILLRSDLELGSAETDLLHPQRYTRPLGPARLDAQIDGWLATHSPRQIGVSDRDLALLVAMREQLHARGATLVILLPPVHPRIREGLEEALDARRARLRRRLDPQGTLLIVDATRALDASQFIDSVHPTNDGARIVTGLIARDLAAER